MEIGTGRREQRCGSIDTAVFRATGGAPGVYLHIVDGLTRPALQSGQWIGATGNHPVVAADDPFWAKIGTRAPDVGSETNQTIPHGLVGSPMCKGVDMADGTEGLLGGTVPYTTGNTVGKRNRMQQAWF